MPEFISFSEEVNVQGYIFLLGSVSVGNVPQLTIDLFITTFKMRKVATIWHPAVVPCVSGDPYFDGPEICTACELFINEDLKIMAMQLRSILEPKHALNFFSDVKSALEKMKLKTVIILTSEFDYELHTVGSDKFFYISDDNSPSDNFRCMKKLTKASNDKYFLTGGGFAVKCYEILKHENCFVVGKYVSEGDNRPDAYSLLIKILPIFTIPEKQVEILCPSSWKYVYGGPPPSGIF